MRTKNVCRGDRAETPRRSITLAGILMYTDTSVVEADDPEAAPLPPAEEDPPPPDPPGPGPGVGSLE